ncbi:MAG: heterodisulfide reductase-related iron-sulfur binding cluster [Acidobacteriota bacterium]|jgi:glycolate oxidase iron-sulfur subunit
MQHRISVEKYGSPGQAMAEQIQACVHCGFCLPTCPTYEVLGEEMDSPRGRIFLMKEVLEEGLPLHDALTHIDRCLGCLACVPACPSGVQYGELLSLFRNVSETGRRRPPVDRLFRLVTQRTLPFPGRFYIAAKLGKLGAPVRSILPRIFSPMLELLPSKISRPKALPKLIRAEGECRARVAFLKGCVQTVLDPEINAATLRVLSRNGVEIVIVADQGCCGALAIHTGDLDQARSLARRNLESFPRDVDAIITNAAGCGSGMKEYPLIFRGLPEEERAREFAGKVRDVTEFLYELGLVSPQAASRSLRLAYHDACHLANAQGVRTAPRELLKAIPNVELLEVPDGEFCCGSAGTYNIEQPEIATVLGKQKARRILDTGADAVAAGNIGCLVQIRKALDKNGKRISVHHTMEFLDRAYSGRL